MHEQKTDSSPGTPVTFPKKLALFAALAVVIVTAYTQFHDVLTLEALAEQEAHLRELCDEHPVVAYGVAFLIYAAVTGLSLPGATVLTLAWVVLWSSTWCRSGQLGLHSGGNVGIPIEPLPFSRRCSGAFRRSLGEIQ